MNDQISVLTKSSFPETLRNASGCPRKLYIRGRLKESKDQKYLCVIGSRIWTQYGADCVNKIIGGLRGYPVSIVSGLALGIDSLAHKAALDYGLHCVGFPGSTLDWNSILPNTSTDLARRIVQQGGALLSEWQVGYGTGKWAFPRRNMHMAAISHATLIIEAAQRSGSLMTARHAEQFDRDVLAVPGSIFAGNSYGTHMLLKRGVRMVTSAEDVLEELGFEVSRSGQISPYKLDTLDPVARKMIEAIMLGETTTEILFDQMNLPIQIFNQKLSELELRDLIRIDGDRLKLR